MQTTRNSTVISQFLLRHSRLDEISDEEDIFAAGHFNSLFALQLVIFVEKTFEIEVKDEDLDIDNFRSVAAITHFIERKLS